MNLTPAEDWNNRWLETYMPGKNRTDFIHQIQADALRFAADKVRSGHFLSNESMEFKWGKAVAGMLDNEANQLHPLPEPKSDGPLTVEEAQRLRVCRICKGKATPGPNDPFILNYGEEYAHQSCLTPEIITNIDP